MKAAQIHVDTMYTRGFRELIVHVDVDFDMFILAYQSLMRASTQASGFLGRNTRL